MNAGRAEDRIALYRFGAVVFDEPRRLLTVKGTPVALERKPLEVLLYLLRHPGEAVTKDQLANACWPGRILSDTVLSKTLGKLRDALGDEDQSYIKTVHGHGYRLVMPVTVEATAAHAPSIPASSARRASRPPRAAEPEHRQLTVMFCDIAGSTPLSQQLGAEDYHELIRGYHAAVTPIVERYEGHIAQYLGDGLLVYFGHPAAHDDDAERAVRCGYDMLTALKRLDSHPPLPLRENSSTARMGVRGVQARIGVHTGQAVIGPVGATERQEMLAMGDTTNIAARLQGIAEPGAILISGATMKLVPGLFITRDLDGVALKGVEQPLQAYQVLMPSGVRTRLEAAEQLTPFVGRESELALLTDRWNQATEGQGQGVLISAEPGLGKSRLVYRFRERMRDSAHTWLECRASPLTRNSAYQPVIELIEQGMFLQPSDNEGKLLTLERDIGDAGLDPLEVLPLLAPLLNLALPERYPPSQYGPEKKRQRTMELLVNWVLSLARLQPAVLAVEDMHWADASTVDLLTLLLEQIPTHKLLVLMTTRPEFQPPWPDRAHMATLSLPPLRLKDTGIMLDSIAGESRLPDTIKAGILKRAEGVPLFLEELTKALVEAGPGDQHLDIPATLQDSLMARLDRLGEAKHVAQVGSVIGREFSYRLLVQVVDLDDSALQDDLARLTDAQLLYQRGSPPDSTYQFKHALIQDTAYQSLLKANRRKLHGKIAQAIEQHFPERASGEPAVLALHFEKAGQVEAAIRYHKAAGEAAANRTAIAEAIDHTRKALALIASLSEKGTKHAEIELDLLLNLAVFQTVSLGYGHPEVERTLVRVQELYPDTSDPERQFRALGGLWLLRFTRGEYDEALRLADVITAAAERWSDSNATALGHGARGFTLFQMGMFLEARRCIERSLSLHTEATSRWSLEAAGSDGIVGGQALLGRLLWFLGMPDRALESSNAAIARANALSHVQTICVAHGVGIDLVLLHRREPEQALTSAQILLDYTQRFGLESWVGPAMYEIGVAQCMLGRFDDDLPRLEEGVRLQLSTGNLADGSFSIGLQAESLLRAGQFGNARAAIEQALSFANRLNERYWEAELHRIHGEMLLAEGAESERVEACFKKGLEISSAQQAKSLELRAATSLARLWHKQGRKREALDLLKPVYDWFTEGFDTADLKDAKALLDDLAAAGGRLV